MAAVTVFVDDAVLGRLPYVCVRDGGPADGLFTIRQPVGDGARLGVLWLLALAGPIGWIALLFISASRAGTAEILTVQLPYSEAAVDRLAAAGRVLRLCVLAGLGGLALAVSTAALGGPVRDVALVAAAVMVVGGIIGGFVAEFRRNREIVEIRLDASRRWASLSGVHPTFVAEVERRRRSSEV